MAVNRQNVAAMGEVSTLDEEVATTVLNDWVCDTDQSPVVVVSRGAKLYGGVRYGVKKKR